LINHGEKRIRESIEISVGNAWLSSVDATLNPTQRSIKEEKREDRERRRSGSK
jgi:hypothetical protein